MNKSVGGLGKNTPDILKQKKEGCSWAIEKVLLINQSSFMEIWVEIE